MAKGYDVNQERRQALSLFGKDLARRAKSKCELTQASGVPLLTYEIPPVPNDPDFERCLLISEDVLAQLEQPRSLRPGEWRHLNEVIWSDIPAVQAMALRILRHLAPAEPWAQNLIEESYLHPGVEALANEAPL
ncbi:MAG: phnA protein [Verrucomicrobiota bacterium]|nr:phnA protein [Verrucomicrobiota bacterium]MED5419471.1 phnA protein [Verrucomicrobiota bacterium]MEE2734464.1 phnA protein [Verrucomicrobiota bacterium]